MLEIHIPYYILNMIELLSSLTESYAVEGFQV